MKPMPNLPASIEPVIICPLTCPANLSWIGKSLMTFWFCLPHAVTDDTKAGLENMPFFKSLHLINTDFLAFKKWQMTIVAMLGLKWFIVCFPSKKLNQGCSRGPLVPLVVRSVLKSCWKALPFTSLRLFWGNSQAPEIGQMLPGLDRSGCPWNCQLWTHLSGSGFGAYLPGPKCLWIFKMHKRDSMYVVMCYPL